MEGMVMKPEFWRGRRVFITGHTGFKGSWLSLWLQQLGAQVTGYALNPPTSVNLFEEAHVAKGMSSIIGDIRNSVELNQALQSSQPEVIFHLAAQALVRDSYADPVNTFGTNVMGTVCLFEAVRRTASVRAVVNVTTDKCYENKEWLWGYREEEPLGGHDPYSSSKACSEIVTSSYRRSFFSEHANTTQQVFLASARAGNVIGGGDWSKDRLVPDALTAFMYKKPVEIRFPNAIRPWQHVLEPLSGYLTLAEALFSDQGERFAQAWNFGPCDDDAQSVKWIVEQLVRLWADGAQWTLNESPQPHEAHYLKLDISKARHLLGWMPRTRLLEALAMTTNWTKAYHSGQSSRALCLSQIQQFSELS
jgi:CDP-glucose 4,6-dehydratase